MGNKLPDGWVLKRFDEVCLKVTDGSHFSPKTAEEGYNYITVKDIDNNGNIDFLHSKKISADDYISLVKNDCQPQKGDVLFSKDGTVGKVALIDFERQFVVLSSLAIIRPNPSTVIPEYIKYLLLSPSVFNGFVGLKAGAAIKRIVLKTIKNYQIPIAPLPEQRRIVAKLDSLFERIDKAIALVEENIKNAQSLMASVLDEMIKPLFKSEKVVKVQDIGRVIRGSSPRPKGDTRYYNGNIPRLMVADVTRDGMYVVPHIDFLTEAGAKLSRPLKKGSFTVQVSGNPCTPAILDCDACIHDGFAAIIDIDRNIVDTPYLYFVFEFFKKAKEKEAQGAIFKNLKTDHIRAFDIPLPDINMQRAIRTSLMNSQTQTKKLLELQSEKYRNLKALKSSLLDAAFNGEL